MTMTRLLRGLEHVSVTLALVAGVSITVLAVLISVDIVGRDLFRISVQGTDEIGGYVLAFVGSLGMALTLLRRGHPRIDLFFRFFPQGLRNFLNVLAQLVMAGFAIFLAVFAWLELQKTIEFGSVTNTPLQTPLWVPQSVWVLGMVFFAFTACLSAFHALALLFSNPGEIEAHYGSPTIDEEVEHYIGHEGEHHAGD